MAARATKRRNVLERPGVAAEVLRLVLEGRSDAEVAAAISKPRASVTRQAITAFRKRHKSELDEATETVVREAVGVAIATKANRIAAKDQRWQLIQQVIKERGEYGAKKWPAEPGMSTGLLVHTVKMIGGGDVAQEVDEFKLDTGLLAELRALEDSAATELGQLPRPDTRVHIDNRTQVLVREYVGFDPREIG